MKRTTPAKIAKEIREALPKTEAREYAYQQLEASKDAPELAMFWREVVVQMLALQ